MSLAHLEFARLQGVTRLQRQHVAYPFHLTRPFYLDRERPDFATLYLQSSSGGLYRGEDLRLDLTLGRNAAVEVTTQAATLVRDARGGAARTETRLRLAPGSTGLYTPDPFILFPNANISTRLHVTLPEDARALCMDGAILTTQAGATFWKGRYGTELLVETATGRPLVRERGVVRLEDEMDAMASPLGRFRAFGTAYLLNGELGESALRHAVEATGCRAGLSPLPNRAGMVLRVLAEDGGRLARGLAVARAILFEALTGFASAPRRK
ncbi:urease accessory protein UreD [Acidocella sp.]|uniref:urease accessory protein UreD n=1 Tax=Acidocella sp. TaxID=50710 RepID=UPI003CFEA2A4